MIYVDDYEFVVILYISYSILSAGMYASNKGKELEWRRMMEIWELIHPSDDVDKRSGSFGK